MQRSQNIHITGYVHRKTNRYNTCYKVNNHEVTKVKHNAVRSVESLSSDKSVSVCN
jgi:hypothetical protein